MDDLIPTSVFGLPTHPLMVHATVVLVPLACAVVALTAVLPRFRAWAGWLPVALAALTVVLVPLSTASGENFEESPAFASPQVHELVEKHQELADVMIWWVLGLLVVAAAAHVLRRTGRDRNRGVALTLAVLGVLVPLGTLVQTALVGHSGAKAVWDGVPVAATDD